MSRAGSMAAARQLPVPLNAMRVPPATVVVSTIVSSEPGDGGGTVAETGLAATAGGTAAGTLCSCLSWAAAPPNSTMTAFARLRTDGVAGLARFSRTRAIPAPSSLVPASTATPATAPDGASGRTSPGATLRRSTSSVSGSGCAAT